MWEETSVAIKYHPAAALKQNITTRIKLPYKMYEICCLSGLIFWGSYEIFSWFNLCQVETIIQEFFGDKNI
jgi:hypothetical protein